MKTGKHEFKRLGREIKISPKAVVSIDHETGIASVGIVIGKDGFATLTMSEEVYEELKASAPIFIETAKEFRKKIK